MDSNDYLTAADVALMLKVSEKSIYRWAAADPTFPQIRLSAGTVRFPRERLLRWLRAREGASLQPARLVTSSRPR